MEQPVDLNRLLFQELFCYQQYQMDGLHSGVPTRTTSTITPVTPTTLGETLETSLLQYQLETESHQNEAGFVPPLVHPMTTSMNSSVTTSLHDNTGGGSMFLNLVDTKNWQGASTTITDIQPMMTMHQGSLSPPIPAHVLSMGSGSSSSGSSTSSSSSVRKNVGGRRPNKESGISPEEEEKRQVRRERNKQAAARCRKRRMDHTNLLINETEALETKQRMLHEEIEKLKLEASCLKRTLEEHESTCMIRCSDSPVDIKPMITNPELGQLMDTIDTSRIYTPQAMTTGMGENLNSFDTMTTNGIRQRPNFLPINCFSEKNATNIPIETPTQDILDSFFMQSGTGLTPITPAIASSCSTQLRSSNGIDLTSPDASVKKLIPL